MEQAVEKKLFEELKDIKSELGQIKEQMDDSVLTPEEEARLDEALAEAKAGKAVSLDEFEKEL
ncbi:MAG: hypothetical protein OXR66_08255 [Candidatus Woesearchaeota archaeon]|nr:hypothetical protein [Candidatus Woesearchaeota archaeon]